MTARGRAMLMASAGLAAVLAVVLFGMMRAGATKRAAGPTGTIDMPPPPAASGGAAGAGDVRDLVAAGERGTWTRQDPQTGLPAARVSWTRLDPAEGGRIALVSPEIHLRFGGRWLRLRSRDGTLLWPSREAEPESGSLEGEVRAELLGEAPRPEEAGAPIATLKTDRLRVESRLSELEAPGRIEVAAPGVDFAGEGLSLAFNETDGTIRTLWLQRGERLVVQPREAQRWADEQRRAAQPTEEPESGASAEAAPRIEHLRATVRGGLTASSAVGRVSADELAAFVRLVDGRLEAGAIGTPLGSSDGATSVGGAGGGAGPAGAAEERWEVAWDGPLEVRSLRERPAELGDEQALVTLRGAADGSASGRVRLADPREGTQLEGDAFRLGLTSLRGELGGSDDRPALGRLGDGSTLSAAGLSFDLAGGRAEARGGGELRGPPEGGDDHISWSEAATFAYASSAGRLIPTEASFRGAVRAHSREGGASGEWLTARFAAQSSSRPALAEVQIGGGARLASAEGSARADSMRVIMGQSGEGVRTTPEWFIAAGGFEAESADGALRGDSAEVRFELDERGRGRPAWAVVSGSVIAEGPDGISARASVLTADLQAETYELAGEPVVLEQRSGEAAGAVTGPFVRLEAQSRRFGVLGGGAAHRFAPGEGAVELRWADWAVYDDAARRAECEGDVALTVRPTPSEIHRGSGARAVVELAPSSKAGESGRLALARLEGGAAPARVELRRFLAPTVGAAAGGPTLEGLIFITGPWVEARGEGERFEAAGPGQLLVEDRRPNEEPVSSNDGGANPLLPSGTRGTTLFEWAGGLVYDREASSVRLTGGARMRHVPLAEGGPIDLSADELGARLSTPEGGAAGTPRVEAVTAEGGVRLWAAGRSLSGGRMEYEAGPGIIRVSAAEAGGSITVVGEADGSVTVAESAMINIRTGEVQLSRIRASGSAQ